MNTNTVMAFEGTMSVGNDAENLIEAENVKDLTLPNPGNQGEVEHTLKKHKGQKAYLKGLIDWVIEGSVSKEYTESESDGTRTLAADVSMILEAAKTRKPIYVSLSDYEEGHGPAGYFLVWTGTTTGSGEEAQTVPFTMKPYAGADAITWH